MRVNPGTGRIYQLSPTSRLGSTPMQAPRPTAPLARKPRAAQEAPKPGLFARFKGFVSSVFKGVSEIASGFAQLFGFGRMQRQDYAGGRSVATGGGGSGTV